MNGKFESCRGHPAYQRKRLIVLRITFPLPNPWRQSRWL